MLVPQYAFEAFKVVLPTTIFAFKVRLRPAKIG